MVEKDAYCMDVVHQLLAVQKAIQRVSSMMLGRNLRKCVIDALEEEDNAVKKEVIRGVLNIFKLNRCR